MNDMMRLPKLIMGTKFLTQVACQKGLDKNKLHNRPRSDYKYFWKKQSDQVLPVCYSDKEFVISSPDYHHLIWEQKKKSVQNFRTFTCK